MKTIDIKKIRKAYLGFTLFHVVIMHIAYFILSATFDFPEVLRRHPGDMLNLYTQNLSINILAYYLFTLSGLTFVGLVLILHYCFLERGPELTAASVFGVLTGVFQSFGFGRWAFLVPVIAARYREASEQGQQTLLMILEAFHAYAGVLVGENLAFVCQGIWTILISVSVIKRTALPRVLGQVGVVIGIFVGSYSLEQFGGVFAVLGILNVAFQIAWLLWLVTIGVYLIKTRDDTVGTIGWKGRVLLCCIYFVMLIISYA